VRVLTIPPRQLRRGPSGHVGGPLFTREPGGLDSVPAREGLRGREWLGAGPSRRAERAVEDSLSGFLTTRYLEWLRDQESGWFAHLSYLRPHPPYAAAGEFATMYDPADVTYDPSYRRAVPSPLARGGVDGARECRADRRGRDASPTCQYYGMISEVDFQLGRVFEAIDARGEWHDTLIVITSDHGEQLGDHGLIEKLGFFPQSYHVIGLWRDPRRKSGVRNVQHFTENVDLLPTLCDALGINSPAQCDGSPWHRSSPVPRYPGARTRTTSGTTAPTGSTTRPRATRLTGTYRDRTSRFRSASRPRTCSSATAPFCALIWRRPHLADRVRGSVARARRSSGAVGVAPRAPRTCHDRHVAANEPTRSVAGGPSPMSGEASFDAAKEARNVRSRSSAKLMFIISSETNP